MRKLLFYIFLFFCSQQLVGQANVEPLTIEQINAKGGNFNLQQHIQVLNDPSGTWKVNDISKPSFTGTFLPLGSDSIDTDCSVHWIRFEVINLASRFEEYKLGIAYTDDVRLFIPSQTGTFIQEESGDLYPLHERSVKNGQMVFLKFMIPHNQKQTYFLRLESTTKISQQFRPQAFQSLKIYSEQGFMNRFTNPRFYQTFFYGALFIMIFYNFFIFISLRSTDYLYYVGYLIGIAVFFSSNAGYVMELLLPNQPRLDLYIRFLSTPILMIFYLTFSQIYLNSKKYSPRTHRIINGLKGIFFLSILVMLVNQWKLGRSIFIFTAIGSYLLILQLAYKEIKRGYTPARYFLAANLLLILGALIFAIPRISGNVQNPITQYGVQFGVILEVSLFSIGLADRINVARKALATEKLKKAELERKQELERKLLIEEKNKELEQKVIERTQEVVRQKEEIELKNQNITASIRYAERIQKALIGESDGLQEILPDSFILFIPKDIVSGDFYWFASIDEKKVIIAADCTGHGVPGAFMTMMGNAFLNDIISENHLTEPKLILEELDKRVQFALSHQNTENKRKDGMDMAILVVDEDAKSVKFAGAKNPVCHLKNGEIERIKGSKYPIGSYKSERTKVFEQKEFELRSGDAYYIFSDGFQDQFGGAEGRKYMTKRFRNLLQSIGHLPMKEQKELLYQEFNTWKQNGSQTDDVLVIGFRLW
ncbi:MAG: 7TM diverse intracellular signaling domain-containing protein [Flammeovirgaceae bacterium]